MSVAARDPWADAWQVATQPVLNRDLVTRRRRIWLRRVSALVVAGAALLSAAWVVDALLTPDVDYLWPTPWSTTLVGFALTGVGLVAMAVATIRSARRGGLERSFVGPEDFLTRSERRWVRTQVAEQAVVPADRFPVVVAVARRMRAEGVQTGTYVGLLLLYVGMSVAAPTTPSVIVFAVLSVFMAVQTVRGLTWSRRARGWLALHAQPSR